MATVGDTVVTFDEWVKRMDKSNVKTIIELAAASNLMLKSAMVGPGNEADGNTTTVRTSYPTGTWTSAYEGVNSEASHTKEVWDAAGYLEGYSVIAKRYVHRSPDRKAARMQEERAFIQGYSEEIEDTFFHGDRDLNPKEFLGLDQRYGKIGAETGGQIIDAGGVGSVNTDIWFVVWGESKCSLFFGMNNTGGLQIDDKGLVPWALNGDTKHQECYVSHYEWNVGLKVEDYRAVARIANIDSTVLTGGAPVDLIPFMIDAYFAIPTAIMNSGNVQIYCNTTVMSGLTQEARNPSAGGGGQTFLTLDTVDGRPFTSFMGIPITRSDKITNAGVRIVA